MSGVRLGDKEDLVAALVLSGRGDGRETYEGLMHAHWLPVGGIAQQKPHDQLLLRVSFYFMLEPARRRFRVHSGIQNKELVR